MLKNSSKAILIPSINFLSLTYSSIYFFLSYRIFFLHLPSNITTITKKLLTILNAQQVNFEHCADIDYAIYTNDKHQIGSKVLKELNINHSLLNIFCNIFTNIDSLPKKLSASIFQIINTELQSLILISCWANSFDKNIKSIIILRHGTICEKIAAKYFNFDLRFDTTTTTIYYIKTCVYFFIQLTTIVYTKIFNNTNKTKPHPFSKTNSTHSVVFFPHQSPMYGSLFAKDYFYSKDCKSPFYPSNILHIEYGVSSNKALLELTSNYYITHKIPFTILPNFRVSTIFNFISAIPTIMLLIFKRQPGSFYHRFFIFLCIFYTYIRYSMSKKHISHYTNLKLALIGYDFLFPKHIALALESLSIQSIAVQERINLSLNKSFNTIIDTYLTGVKPSLIMNTQNKNSSINEYFNIGFPRSDLLIHYKHNTTPTTSRLKEINKKIVLVLDYHSINNAQINCLQPLINWKNNIDFLEDIVNLSQQFKDCYFVIRSKNHDWLQIPAFCNIINTINQTDNIEINGDYTTPNVSYMIGAIASLVIAQYSSFGDECLSIGIPVVFHDYASNMKSVMRDIQHYDNAPVYATNFSELVSLTRLGLDTSYTEHHEKLQRLRSSFYQREDSSAVCPKIQKFIEDRLAAKSLAH